MRTRRGELSLRINAFELLSKSLRPLPEKFHGLTDIETRYRRRYLDTIVNDESREVFVKRARIIAAIRRFLDDARLRRGRDAGPAAALRRRPGEAFRDPSQRARPRPLPAHRHRALPQALHHRRHRPRLRDRQGLPQRRRELQAQPRVHDARNVRGLRRLQLRHGHGRADDRRGGRGGRRRARSSSAARRSTSRRPGRVSPCGQAIRNETGIDSGEHARCRRAAGGHQRRSASTSLLGADVGHAGRRALRRDASSPSSMQPVFITEHPLETSPVRQEDAP